jgi:hypothetical protein
MPTDEIIVLACSRKWGGRCVAGVSTQSGRWLRPVLSRPRDGLGPYYWRIDGRAIRPLDVVSLEHDGELADPSQPENVAVGSSRWKLAGAVDPADAAEMLASHLTDGPGLLGNRGAAMPEEEAAKGVEASLALVRPLEVEFHLEPPWEGTGKRRPRVQFDLNGQHYDLAVTDYVVAPRLMAAGLGRHEISSLGFAADASVHLTVSLAEPRDGWCTKLVAAVMPLPERS